MLFKKSLITLCVASLNLTAFSAEAAEPVSTIVAPNCLINKLNTPYKKLATTNDLSLIQTNKDGLNQLVQNKMAPNEVCGGFVNVSTAWNEAQTKQKLTASFAKTFLKQYAIPAQAKKVAIKPPVLNHSQEVAKLYSLLTPANLMSTLKNLSSFKDRYANNDTGVKSADWVRKQIETMIETYHRKDVSVSYVATAGYKQPSLVVKISNNTNESKPALIIGSHMDTVASYGDPMPGADDDGSGTVTIMEAFRTVLESSMTFNKPIYFIWYSAEEDGLIGSQNVVKYFKKNNIPVEYELNFDMTGYDYQNERTLYLLSDYTNNELNSYVEAIEKQYVKQDVVYTACGYACSDHATWTQQGYKAAAPCEGKLDWEWHVDPYIHTTNDRLEVLSVEHMTDFVKLALGFVAEAGDPVNS